MAAPPVSPVIPSLATFKSRKRDVEQLSRNELEQLIAHNENLMKNSSLVAKLADGGVKLLESQKKAVAELKARTLTNRGHIDASNLAEVFEWTTRIGASQNSLVASGASASTSTGTTETGSSNTNPFANLKPNKTVPMLKQTRQNMDAIENSGQNRKVQLLSLEESVALQLREKGADNPNTVVIQRPTQPHLHSDVQRQPPRTSLPSSASLPSATSLPSSSMSQLTEPSGRTMSKFLFYRESQQHDDSSSDDDSELVDDGELGRISEESDEA